MSVISNGKHIFAKVQCKTTTSISQRSISDSHTTQMISLRAPAPLLEPHALVEESRHRLSPPPRKPKPRTLAGRTGSIATTALPPTPSPSHTPCSIKHYKRRPALTVGAWRGRRPSRRRRPPAASPRSRPARCARETRAGAPPRPRVISDCHFSVQLNHFIPFFLSYSVAVFRN